MLCYFVQNPLSKFRYSCTYSWQIRLCTANAPTYYPTEEPTTTFSFNNKRSTRITLKLIFNVKSNIIASLGLWYWWIYSLTWLCRKWCYLITWQESRPPLSYPAHIKISGITSCLPALKNIFWHFSLLTIGTDTCNYEYFDYMWLYRNVSYNIAVSY